MLVRKRYVRRETPESRIALAVTKPNSKNTEALLAEGVNSNLRYDRSPIIFSATLPNLRVLHAHGANLDIQSDTGYTLLNELCHRHKNVPVYLNETPRIQFLLDNGADPNLPDKINGNTPLHNLCRLLIDPVIIRLLLQHGADPNIQNSAGETPLHCLAGNVFIFMGNPNLPYRESIGALLEGGANPHIKDEDGHLPSKHGRTIFSDRVFSYNGAAEGRMLDYLESIEKGAPLPPGAAPNAPPVVDGMNAQDPYNFINGENYDNQEALNETNANRFGGGRRHRRRKTRKGVGRKRQGRTRRRH